MIAALMGLATVVASVATISDPTNGSLTPKATPGAVMEYTLTFTNGAVALDSGTVKLKTGVPTGTKLYLGDLGGTGSGPVSFTNGLIVSSGMTYTFTNLGDTGDDLEFSKDGGTTWTYTPVSDGTNYDPAVTNIRIKPRNACNALGVFTVKFRVAVK